MPALAPKAGFDWGRVAWGRPDSVPTVLCSYCSASLPEDSCPLILSTREGHAARFCDACQTTWFGIEIFAEPTDEDFE
jgi:hypothetical protein